MDEKKEQGSVLIEKTVNVLNGIVDCFEYKDVYDPMYSDYSVRVGEGLIMYGSSLSPEVGAAGPDWNLEIKKVTPKCVAMQSSWVRGTAFRAQSKCPFKRLDIGKTMNRIQKRLKTNFMWNGVELFRLNEPWSVEALEKIGQGPSILAECDYKNEATDGVILVESFYFSLKFIVRIGNIVVCPLPRSISVYVLDDDGHNAKYEYGWFSNAGDYGILGEGYARSIVDGMRAYAMKEGDCGSSGRGRCSGRLRIIDMLFDRAG